MEAANHETKDTLINDDMIYGIAFSGEDEGIIYDISKNTKHPVLLR
jgi:hypothetical protein